MSIFLLIWTAFWAGVEVNTIIKNKKNKVKTDKWVYFFLIFQSCFFVWALVLIFILKR